MRFGLGQDFRQGSKQMRHRGDGLGVHRGSGGQDWVAGVVARAGARSKPDSLARDKRGFNPPGIPDTVPRMTDVPDPAPTDLTLATRTGLPDEFRLILAGYPRESWPDHRDFNGLAAFWLDRHLGFRRMLTALTDDAQARIDRRLAPDDHARRLSASWLTPARRPDRPSPDRG